MKKNGLGLIRRPQIIDEVTLKPNNGCLSGKTKRQKTAFFKSLASFYIADNKFFMEQYLDLLWHEKNEFVAYCEKNKIKWSGGMQRPF